MNNDLYDVDINITGRIKQTIKIVDDRYDIEDIIDGLADDRFHTTVSHSGKSGHFGLDQPSITNEEGEVIARVTKQRELDVKFSEYELREVHNGRLDSFN